MVFCYSVILVVINLSVLVLGMLIYVSFAFKAGLVASLVMSGNLFLISVAFVLRGAVVNKSATIGNVFSVSVIFVL